MVKNMEWSRKDFAKRFTWVKAQSRSANIMLHDVTLRFMNESMDTNDLKGGYIEF